MLKIIVISLLIIILLSVLLFLIIFLKAMLHGFIGGNSIKANFWNTIFLFNGVIVVATMSTTGFMGYKFINNSENIVFKTIYYLDFFKDSNLIKRCGIKNYNRSLVVDNSKVLIISNNGDIKDVSDRCKIGTIMMETDYFDLKKVFK